VILSRTFYEFGGFSLILTRTKQLSFNSINLNH